MKKSIKASITLFLVCLWFSSAKAQVTIDVQHNNFRLSDELKEYVLQIPSNYWNLSDIKIKNKNHIVKYKDLVPIYLTAVENNERTYYYENSKGIEIAGIENPQYKISYNEKEVWLPYPFKLGDKVSGTFYGEGHYCDKLYVREFGHYQTNADTIGTLITPNGDSIPNVLRIHSIRLKNIVSYPIDSLCKTCQITEDSINKYININANVLKEECYRWYKSGYRYPILISKVFSNMNGKNIYDKILYYYPPTEQSYLSLDDENNIIRNKEPNNNLNSSESDINGTLNYKFSYNQEERMISILFSNNSTTKVLITLADNSGIVYQSKQCNIQSGKLDEIKISYAGLHRGEYVLNIHSANNAYVEKFKVK